MKNLNSALMFPVGQIGVFACVILIGCPCWGAIRHVPGVYPNIQAGIDAAIDGDTVLVAAGTYVGDGNRNLQLNGKKITVRSDTGPSLCIIQGGGSGYGFNLYHGETVHSVIAGFTITNFSSAIRIVGNSAPLITNCILTGNDGSYGGGIWSEPNVKRIPIITNCLIIGNTASSHGAGIWSKNGLLVKNCLIANNSSDINGGGISHYMASSPGYVPASRYVNCTITGNHAVSVGGGINESGTSFFTNCIIWGNYADYLNDEINLSTSNCEAVITYSNVRYGFSGPGNINSDPLFVTGDFGDYYLSQTSAGQTNNSPCLDIGSTTASRIWLESDSSRQDLSVFTTRTDAIADSGTVDMGFHYPGSTTPPTPTPTPSGPYNLEYFYIDNKLEYRCFYENHHFLTVEDYFIEGITVLRAHPGHDPNGWGSSLYPMSRINALLRNSWPTTAVTNDEIEFSVTGNICDGGSGFGYYACDLDLTYDPNLRQVDGTGYHHIEVGMTPPLDWDLTVMHIASNFLCNVHLLSGGTGDTGDLESIDYQIGSYAPGNWIPSDDNSGGYYPWLFDDDIEIYVHGNYNEINGNLQYSPPDPITPAYKPDTGITLIGQQANTNVTLGGYYDVTSSVSDPCDTVINDCACKKYWLDNTGVFPLILKENPLLEYDFYMTYVSRPIPGDPTPTPTPTTTPTPVCLHHGDVNFDNEVTAADAQLAFQIALGIITPTFEQACAADCNGDGTVTAGDAQQIFYVVLGSGSCADPLP